MIAVMKVQAWRLSYIVQVLQKNQVWMIIPLCQDHGRYLGGILARLVRYRLTIGRDLAEIRP